MKLGILALRVTIGGFFVGHGSQKLVGAQGGPGLKATGKHFEEAFGIKPGLAQATVAAVSETAGGLGLVLGYHTPLAASAVVGSMTTAIQKVHGKNGWNVQNGGFEYNAVLIAAAVAIAEQGPGFLSLDALRGKQHKGIFWGVFALGAGVGGAFASHAVSGYFGGGAPGEGVDAGAVVDSLVDSAKDVANSAADAAQDIVNSAADTTRDAVDSAADSVKDATASAADSAKDAANSAADSAKDAVDSASDGNASAADSLKDAAGSAADSVKDAASSAADSVKDAADSAKDAADSAS